MPSVFLSYIFNFIYDVNSNSLLMDCHLVSHGSYQSKILLAEILNSFAKKLILFRIYGAHMCLVIFVPELYSKMRAPCNRPLHPECPCTNNHVLSKKSLDLPMIFWVWEKLLYLFTCCLFWRSGQGNSVATTFRSGGHLLIPRIFSLYKGGVYKMSHIQEAI